MQANRSVPPAVAGGRPDSRAIAVAWGPPATAGSTDLPDGSCASVGEGDAQLAQARRVGRVGARGLFAVDVAVEYVALLRAETGLAYEVAQHLLVCRVVRARGRDDVLLNHHRAHVV